MSQVPQNVFTIGDLTVDFSNYDIDLVARGRTRLLAQFDNSEVLCCLLDAISEEVQELQNALHQCFVQRSLARAGGAQLDVLGDLVGQTRELVEQGERAWFGTDVADDIAPVDEGELWLDPVPVAGSIPADDGQYFDLILSKIFKNHIKYASLPEISQFVRLLTGFDVGFEVVAPLDVILLVPPDVPAYVVRTLQRVLTNTAADDQYLLPIAATTRLVGAVVYAENPMFIVDVGGYGVDEGLVSVRS